MRRSLTIATWFSTETDQGRGILRGVAQQARHDPAVRVLKLRSSRPLSLPELRALGVKGVIVASPGAADVSPFGRANFPFINVTGRAYLTGVPTVRSDDTLIGVWAARYLHSRGYRNLGYCGMPEFDGSGVRENAMRETAAMLGATFARAEMLPALATGTSPRRIASSLGRWLRSIDLPVGLLVISDEVCDHFAEACDAAGLRIPEDVALLGVGVDSGRRALSLLDISSIELNNLRVGQLACSLLLDAIRGLPAPRVPVEVPPLKIVTRRSSDRFAVDDERVAQALDFIREHAQSSISVPDVLAVVKTSRRSLENRFRAATGRSIYEEIQRQRFERAVSLMAEPGHTMAEIADAAGFRSGRHLSIAFRKRFRASPTSYRARLQKGAAPAASPWG